MSSAFKISNLILAVQFIAVLLYEPSDVLW